MTGDEYQALVDEQTCVDVDCAHCLMPLRVLDVVVDGADDVVQVIYAHATTNDMFCEDQEPPHNIATPRA